MGNVLEGPRMSQKVPECPGRSQKVPDSPDLAVGAQQDLGGAVEVDVGDFGAENGVGAAAAGELQGQRQPPPQDPPGEPKIPTEIHQISPRFS